MMDVVSLANFSRPAKTTERSYLHESVLPPVLMTRAERQTACRPPCGLTAWWRGRNPHSADCHRLFIHAELLNRRPFLRFQAGWSVLTGPFSWIPVRRKLSLVGEASTCDISSQKWSRRVTGQADRPEPPPPPQQQRGPDKSRGGDGASLGLSVA